MRERIIPHDGAPYNLSPSCCFPRLPYLDSRAFTPVATLAANFKAARQDSGANNAQQQRCCDPICRLDSLQRDIKQDKGVVPNERFLIGYHLSFRSKYERH